MRLTRGCRILYPLLGGLLAACQRPAPSAPGGPEAGIDPGRAFLKLSEIQPAARLPQGEPLSRGEPVEAAARYLTKAQERFNEQLWSETVSTLEKALQIEPQLVEARLLLARAAMRQGNNNLAESHLREVLRSDPREVAAYQMLGEIAWQEGKTAEAIESLRLALAASEGSPARPERILAQLTLAMALRKEGYLSAAVDALEAYESAAEHPTAEMTACRELAEVMVLYRGKAVGLIGEIQTQLGRHDLAAKAYERAVAQTPDDLPLRVRLAQSLARAGRADAAIDAVRRIIAENPEDPSGLALLQEVCGLVKQPQRFDAELIELARSARGPGLRMQLAELLLSRDKTSAAMEVLQEITSQDPENVKARCLLARLLLRRGAAAQAVDLLARTLAEHPGSYREVEAVLRPSEGRTSPKDWIEAAAARCREAPGDAAGRYLHGYACATAGRADEAVREYKAAATENPKFGPAWAALARILVDQKKWSDAVDAAQAAIKGGIADGDIYSIKGRAHLGLEQHEEGEAALLEAFRQNPKSAEPLFALAEEADRRGEKKRCEQLYKRILDDVDPRHLAARERLIRMYLNSDKLDKAKDYFSDFERFGQTGAAVDRCRAYLDLASSQEPSGATRLEKFRSELTQISKKYPGDAETQIELAMTYFTLSDFAAALAATDAALAIQPSDARARELKATVLAKLLDFEGAAALIRALAVDRPRDLKYQRTLLDLALNQADWSTALDLLEKLAAESDQKDAKEFFTRQWIECLVIGQRFDEAADRAKQWLEDAPADAARRDAYLSALRAAKKYDEAIDAAGKGLADDPTGAELRAQYVSQLLAADRLVEAQQKVLSWLAADSDDIGLNLLLIEVLRRAEDWDGAVELAQAGAELSQHRSRYQTWLAETLYRAKRFDEAVPYYRARVKAQPSREACLALMEVLEAARRWDEAEQFANSVLAPQLARRDAGEEYDRVTVLLMRRRLAHIYQETDRSKAAFAELEEILKMAPHDPGINNDLGYSWADAGMNLDRAEKMVRLAVGEQPRTSAYLDSLGWVYYKQGKIDDALVYLDRALRMAPYEDRLRQGDPGRSREAADPVIHDHYADALYRTGQGDQAAEHWRKARALIDARREEDMTREISRLKGKLDAKLEQWREGRPVDVAPLATIPAGSQPGSVQAHGAR
jgi:tetratricopeptide (TPR) repeat protein